MYPHLGKFWHVLISSSLWGRRLFFRLQPLIGEVGLTEVTLAGYSDKAILHSLQQRPREEPKWVFKQKKNGTKCSKILSGGTEWKWTEEIEGAEEHLQDIFRDSTLHLWRQYWPTSHLSHSDICGVCRPFWSGNREWTQGESASESWFPQLLASSRVSWRQQHASTDSSRY